MTPAETAYTISAASSTGNDERVLQELPQVYYIAARIYERLPQHVEMEDLVSAGVVGLLEAIRSFDSSREAQFRTYAKFRIRGAILDSLREMDWGSRLLRRRGREIAETTARLQARLGRHPVEAEIAAEMHLSLDQLRQLTAQLNTLHVSGQQVAATSDQSDLVDVIESAPNLDDPDPFELCMQEERKQHLAEAVARLSEREQLILSLYYREELTMKEIAQVVGIAVSRVSQIRQESFAKLREYLAHMQEPAAPRDKKAQESFGYAW